MRRGRFASLAVRQAIATVIPMLVALAIFAGAAIATVRAAGRAELLHAIDTDIAGLVDVTAQGGPTELARRIADRTALASTQFAPAYYLVIDAAGRRFAGNLRAVPPLAAATSQAGEVQAGGAPLLARATMLRGGYRLYVGRSLAGADATVRLIARRIALASIAIVAATLLIAIAMARSLARRVATLNAAFDRFRAGDLLARPPPDPLRDEFGLLTRNIDRVLAASAGFVETQRHITDNLAHELRTPLTHLDTRIHRLAAGLPPETALATELTDARQDIRSIISLFDVLLDIALTESTAHDRPVRINLSELVGGIADLYAASMEEAGIGFSVRIAPAVEILGEPMQLSRLLTNLLDNALKFVPAGCGVRLSVAPGPRLIVEDNGPGVASADRERIFSRFTRGTDTGEAGHGLGLALARVIAMRHGLALTVEDAQPGARFVAQPAGRDRAA